MDAFNFEKRFSSDILLMEYIAAVEQLYSAGLSSRERLRLLLHLLTQQPCVFKPPFLTVLS